MPLPPPPQKLGTLLAKENFSTTLKPTPTKKAQGKHATALPAALPELSTAAPTAPSKVPTTAPLQAKQSKANAIKTTSAAAHEAQTNKALNKKGHLQDHAVTETTSPKKPKTTSSKNKPAQPETQNKAKTPNTRNTRGQLSTKIFVLDTSVLMHDPTSLFHFHEHDVFLTMMTLEELDNHKIGMSEVSRNVRQTTRTLDLLVRDMGQAMETGIPLSHLGNKEAQGNLFFQTHNTPVEEIDGFPKTKADNQILGVMSALKRQYPQREVVLVSKDINMRIKAQTLGLKAEDYFTDHVLDDSDLLYPGVLALPQNFWEKHSKGMESWQEPKTGSTYYRLRGPLCPTMLHNQFAYLEPADGQAPIYTQVMEVEGNTAVLKTLCDYRHQKNNVWGITARNREQNFALNLLMNPDIDLVTLVGQAGTGKTLLALAAGLSQTLDQKRYNEIIVTRATVPVGDDIGFLPGTEEEKMQPWMGAFDDNLEVLQKTDDSEGDWGRAATQDLIRSRLKIKSLNFMRGRTFVNKFLIIDEAQNLTPKQMKTLITRAGPGTKIVCLGNLAQIDTPYLTEGGSGLTYTVDRFKGWEHSGHVTLARGERSRLADQASDIL